MVCKNGVLVVFHGFVITDIFVHIFLNPANHVDVHFNSNDQFVLAFLQEITGPADSCIFLTNVIASRVLNGFTFYIIGQQHPNQRFVLVSIG